jgi:ABC-2 type transport system ATP-binding protein
MIPPPAPHVPDPVVRTERLTKRYGSFTALDHVDITLHRDTIHGLLGRNGAGKTTLMSILTAQNFATSGRTEIFGEQPYENERVLRRICFVRESQKYPDTYAPKHAFASAAMFFPNWDEAFARQLAAEFQLPVKREIKKLSRGQLSAVGVIIGLAARADITFFDEPYLGLDAIARQLFYDRLLEDYSENPRTIVLSSHLIDEISELIEHVIVLDEGKVLMDEDVDSLRGRASTVLGPAATVADFTSGKDVIHEERFHSLSSRTISSPLNQSERMRAAELGLEIAPVSLQQLVVRTTMGANETDGGAGDAAVAFGGGDSAGTSAPAFGASVQHSPTAYAKD